MTTIKATKTLSNNGVCFVKGACYYIDYNISNEAGLMEAKTINEQGEPHIIGSWWRHFKIV